MPGTVEMTKEIVGTDTAGLRFELGDDHVGTLTLDRADVLNAINWDLYRGLARSIEMITAMPEVRVLVVTGSEKAFCAGGDINFMRQMHEGEIDTADVQNVALRVFNGLIGLPQPTIAVVQGPAVGLGATLALACDMVIAADNARIADPHVQIGLVPGDGGIVLWPLLVGPARAKEFLFTGDVVKAADAMTLGLVNHVYPVGEALERGMALAARLAAGPQTTIQATKTLTNHVLRDLSERVVRSSLAAELASQHSGYHHEAVAGFLAGNPKRF